MELDQRVTQLAAPYLTFHSCLPTAASRLWPTCRKLSCWLSKCLKYLGCLLLLVLFLPVVSTFLVFGLWCSCCCYMYS